MGKKRGGGGVNYRRLEVDEAEEKAPKGYVPILVGSGEEVEERFLIHTQQLRHPCFALLLDMAASEFGYEQQGILRIPCDVAFFRRVVAEAEQSTQFSSSSSSSSSCGLFP